MSKILKVTRFGNPTLRSICAPVTKEAILSDGVQTLISDIRYTLKERPYGVGMAAPQVGRNIALSVIGIKPTPTRPDLTPFNSVIINPSIVEPYGRRSRMWEGCISCGTGKDILYAQVPRYKKVKLAWTDEYAIDHEEIIEGFVAHVAQHEVDHLSGILFVDRVKDPSTYMMADEFNKRVSVKKLR